MNENIVREQEFLCSVLKGTAHIVFSFNIEPGDNIPTSFDLFPRVACRDVDRCGIRTVDSQGNVFTDWESCPALRNLNEKGSL